ncbi:MAG TPA: hypothetical protein VGD14_09380 [bacterium]
MDQNKDIREKLTQAKKDGHFIFVPSTPLPQVNGIFVPVLDIIKLRSDDFYSTSGKFGLHHHAAMKLADAAGIQWAAESGRVGRMDNRDNPNYCSFRVVGRYRTQEGLWAEVAGHKHIDLDAKKDAIEEKYRTQFSFKIKDSKAGKGKAPWPADEKEFIRYYTERDMNQIKETLDERCESGAQVRVIRNILHLPVAFSPYPNDKNQHDGISKNFYLVRYTLDASNQLVQQAQLASFQQAILGIYGQSVPVTAHTLPTPKIKEIPAETEPDDQGPDETGNPTSDESMIIDFENQSPEDQVKTIEAMVKKTGYAGHDATLKQFKAPVHKWDPADRTGYLIHIMEEGRKK